MSEESNTTKYYVSEEVRRVLKEANASPGVGWLLGYQEDSVVEITTVCRTLDDAGEELKNVSEKEVHREIDNLDALFPRGVEVLGVVGIFRDSINASILTVLSKLRLTATSAVVYRNKLYNLGVEASHIVYAVWCNQEFNIFENEMRVDYDWISDFQQSHFNTKLKLTTFGLQVNLPVYQKISQNSQVSSTDLMFDQLLLELYQDSTIFVHTGHPVDQNYKKLVSGSDEGNLGELSELHHLDFQPFILKDESSLDSTAPPKYVFQKLHPNSKVKCTSFSFIISCAAYIPKDESVKNLREKYFCHILKTQIKKFQKIIKDFPDSKEYCCLRFENSNCQHPVLEFFPFNPKKEKLDKIEISNKKSVQKSLYLRFFLPKNIPFFQYSQALNISIPINTSGIVDIHKNLKNPEIKEGGQLAIVKGSYEYFHYGQDGFNDSGWGCAYRSLQTLFSWFRLQHYTNTKIPSHKQIQEALVEMGDKGADFIGSKGWIGSIEVGYILDELLGVNHRIVSKGKDEEVLAIARQLLEHFKKEGTPVSIGGGVLAYTLLGVYFNEKTSEVKLLILDPHYLGPDDAGKIVKEGWVAWKSPSDKATAGGPLFARDTFYNFMCPMRPNVV